MMLAHSVQDDLWLVGFSTKSKHRGKGQPPRRFAVALGGYDNRNRRKGQGLFHNGKKGISIHNRHGYVQQNQ